jgi:hypothetical protein
MPVWNGRRSSPEFLRRFGGRRVFGVHKIGLTRLENLIPRYLEKEIGNMCHQFTEMFGVVAVLVDDFLIVRNDATLVTY